MMKHSKRRLHPAACAAGLLVCTLFAAQSWADVIYEFREVGSSAVIGTLEVVSPPASASSGWSTVDLSDLIGLSLDDGVFGLGTGNLLSVAVSVGGSVLSLNGSNLDVGSSGITFPTVFPSLPTDPTIDESLSLLFGVAAGADFIGRSRTLTLPGGGSVIDDLFLFGDWTVARVPVPEPGTAALGALALAAVVRAAKRRRR
jgi:hypothetical protein